MHATCHAVIVLILHIIAHLICITHRWALNTPTLCPLSPSSLPLPPLSSCSGVLIEMSNQRTYLSFHSTLSYTTAPPIHYHRYTPVVSDPVAVYLQTGWLPPIPPLLTQSLLAWPSKTDHVYSWILNPHTFNPHCYHVYTWMLNPQIFSYI